MGWRTSNLTFGNWMERTWPVPRREGKNYFGWPGNDNRGKAMIQTDPSYQVLWKTTNSALRVESWRLLPKTFCVSLTSWLTFQRKKLKISTAEPRRCLGINMAIISIFPERSPGGADICLLPRSVLTTMKALFSSTNFFWPCSKQVSMKENADIMF